MYSWECILIISATKTFRFTSLVFFCLQIKLHWGTWVAQSVKRPTLGFGSGCDLRGRETELALGSVLGAQH